jgi:hypothetical protein
MQGKWCKTFDMNLNLKKILKIISSVLSYWPWIPFYHYTYIQGTIFIYSGLSIRRGSVKFDVLIKYSIPVKGPPFWNLCISCDIFSRSCDIFSRSLIVTRKKPFNWDYSVFTNKKKCEKKPNCYCKHFTLSITL